METPTSTDEVIDVDAVVVGAGFAGLYMLHRLRDVLGLRTKVIEAAGGVGGTWYWCRYPGARCDVESQVYCYSFSKELLQDWEWSERYPSQPELLRYMNHVADRFDLRRDIELGTSVISAHFDDEARCWTVSTDTGLVYRAQFFITGVGLLASSPYQPDFPGISDFSGEVYHTGRWPQEEVDFRGKRVGVIGTGSTCVQAGPAIAEEADHLFVFQRTAQYVIPARHARLTAEDQREIKEHYDEIWELCKRSVGGFPFEHNGQSAFDVSDEERRATFDRLWEVGGFRFLGESYNDLLTNDAANDSVSEFVREKMRLTVGDPALAERLLPDPKLPLGGKRPIIATGYLEMFNRDNVTLVDVRDEPIESFTESGLQVGSRTIPLDVVVFATGFDAITGPYLRMDIRGRGGRTLEDKWHRNGVKGYLGIGLSGFPNLFMITGPGSTFGNLVVSIEHHVEWIADCIDYMRKNDYDLIEAEAAAEEEWSERIERQVARTVTGRVDSWFNGANIPGKPRGTLVFLGHFGLYRRWVDEAAENGYAGFELASAKPRPAD